MDTMTELLKIVRHELDNTTLKTVTKVRKSLIDIVERYVSYVFYSERIIRVFYSQSDKVLGVFYPK